MLKHAWVSIYGPKCIVNFHMWFTVVYTGGGAFDLFLFCFYVTCCASTVNHWMTKLAPFDIF